MFSPRFHTPSTQRCREWWRPMRLTSISNAFSSTTTRLILWATRIFAWIFCSSEWSCVDFWKDEIQRRQYKWHAPCGTPSCRELEVRPFDLLIYFSQVGHFEGRIEYFDACYKMVFFLKRSRIAQALKLKTNKLQESFKRRFKGASLRKWISSSGNCSRSASSRMPKCSRSWGSLHQISTNLNANDPLEHVCIFFSINYLF